MQNAEYLYLEKMIQIKTILWSLNILLWMHMWTHKKGVRVRIIQEKRTHSVVGIYYIFQ